MVTTEVPLNDVKAAIFDMDGTMIDNMHSHQQAWQTFMQRHGITMSDQEFKQKVSGKKNDQIFELVFGRQLSDKENAQYAEEKEALYRQFFAPHMHELPGLTKTVHLLHAKNIPTAIATTAPQKNRDFALESLGLQNEFSAILGDEHVTNGKPDPEIYLATAKELGVAPANCLVFEDSPPGVAAAKNAGMQVVGIVTTHSAQELHQADYLVQTFDDIQFVQAKPKAITT